MPNVLTAKDGSLFVQLTPGGAMEYVGCLDLDPITEPSGDLTLIQCRQPDRSFKAVGSVEGVPGAVTTSIKAQMYPDADILDRIKACLVNLYVVSGACGKLGVFPNYDRGFVIANSKITSRKWENLVMREASDAVIRTLDVSAYNLFKYRKLKVTAESIAETASLNDIAVCNDEVCAGDCGAAREAGQDLVTVSNAPAGSPTVTADVWQSDDGGSIWVNLTGGPAHPFGAGYDIKSIVCFDIDRDTKRWLVAREQVAGAHYTVAYSDDGGATWTSVEVHDLDNEGAMGQGALFALDQYHIWTCTSAGNVFFSADGGVTWTDLNASTASGAAALYQIDFADANNGYAVGATDAIIQTVDGGDTWAAITSPTSGKVLNTVTVFNRYRLIIGGSGDSLYISWNEGEDWTALSFTGKSTTGTVKALDFVNDVVGFMAHDTAAPVGTIHRTVNGGHDWERLDNPATNAGLNAVVGVDENLAHAVGNSSGGTAIAYRISG